jgi:LSU ribosomal protein L13P
MIIDGKNAVLGRLASYAAKAANEGEDVIIVNAGT